MSNFASSIARMPTIEERKAKAQRAEAWNGKQKHGTHARHRQVMQHAAEERTTFKAAESAGEFVTVRRNRKQGNDKRRNDKRRNNKHRDNDDQSMKLAPIPTQKPSRFAALLASDEPTTVVHQPTTKQVSWATVVAPSTLIYPREQRTTPDLFYSPREFADFAAEAETETKPKTETKLKRIGLKNGSWADECDSDDED